MGHGPVTSAAGLAAAKRVSRRVTGRVIEPLRSHIDERTADLQRQIDRRADEIRDRVSETTERLALLTTRVESLERTLARVEQRLSATTEEILQLCSDQVDGANDANEALGRLLARLRGELASLAEAVAGLQTEAGARAT